MSEIDKNCECVEGSFLENLWREYSFNTKLLDRLISSIIDLIKTSKDIDDYCLRLQFIVSHLPKLFFIHSRINVIIISHFDPIDLFKIINFNSDVCYEYIERLRFVIECFIENDYNRILEYEDDLGKLI